MNKELFSQIIWTLSDSSLNSPVHVKEVNGSLFPRWKINSLGLCLLSVVEGKMFLSVVASQCLSTESLNGRSAEREEEVSRHKWDS